MTKGKIRRIINIVLLAAMLLIVLTPVWWAVVLSFDRTATTALPEFSWLPHEFSTFNYKAAARLIDLPRYYLNILFVTAVNTFVSVFFAMMCGFAFAKGKFWGKKFLYVFMLAVMMVPFECRINDIVIQSWSSLQYGFFEGTFLENEKYPKLNDILRRLAEKYGVTNGAIAIAWILRCPGIGQAVVGTTNIARIRYSIVRKIEENCFRKILIYIAWKEDSC